MQRVTAELAIEALLADECGLSDLERVHRLQIFIHQSEADRAELEELRKHDDRRPCQRVFRLTGKTCGRPFHDHDTCCGDGPGECVGFREVEP